jgi:hypothetical protein
LRILVSSDVAEEISDLAILLKKMPTDHLEVHLHGPRGSATGPPGIFHTHSSAVPHHGSRLTLLLRAMEMIRFVSRAGRMQPDVILSGFPMVKHRLAAKLFRIHHIVYFRGLMFDPSVRSGYSDRVRLGPLGRYLRTDLFDSTKATHILTVADTNRQFLLRRGADDERITLIGPVWLDGISLADSGERRVFFLTSALAAHGFASEHRAQVATVIKVATSGVLHPLIVRVHPRDFYDYENDPSVPATVGFDRSPPQEFLKQLRTDDILVAPVSTLAFEALHLGGRVLFYSSPELGNYSERVFAMLGIAPLTLDELLGEGALDRAISARSIFSPVEPGAFQSVLARVLESAGPPA